MGRDARFSGANELCFSKWNALWGTKLLWFVLYFQPDCKWHSHRPLHDLALGSSRSFVACTRHAVTSHTYCPQTTGNGWLNVWVRFYFLWNQASSFRHNIPTYPGLGLGLNTALGCSYIDKIIIEKEQEDQATTSCKWLSLKRFASSQRWCHFQTNWLKKVLKTFVSQHIYSVLQLRLAWTYALWNTQCTAVGLAAGQRCVLT